MEADVQEEIRHITRDLAMVEVRLRGLAVKLAGPPSPRDEEDDALDPAAKVRSVLECVLVDRVQPALRDLRAVMGG
ncbi:MAG TPA: hypothetical protein VGH73_03970 [Thermoanaerobaculia bacterium]